MSIAKEYRFNVTKDARKELAAAISDITGCKARYTGAPGFAFVVGSYTVSMNGTVTADDELDAQAHNNLLARLAERGFAYEKEELDDYAGYDVDGDATLFDAGIADGGSADTYTAATGETVTGDSAPLAVDIPLSGLSLAAIANLERLIASKSWIIKKMTGADVLPIERLKDRLSFPWFRPDSSHAEIDAYSRLVTRLCETAKQKRRISSRENLPGSGDNEKYKARCMLLALGFIGSEYSQARKALLRNFPGNGSFLQGDRKNERVYTTAYSTAEDTEPDKSFGVAEGV